MVAPHISRTRRQAGRREPSEPQLEKPTMRLAITRKTKESVFMLARPGITSIQLLLASEDTTECLVSLICRCDNVEHTEHFNFSTMLDVSF